MEIIPKQKQEYPFFTQILFFGSMLFLLASVGGYFLLLSLQAKSAGKLQGIQQLLSQGTTPEEAMAEKTIFQYRDKFNDFSLLAQKKNDVRPVFEFLESYTHPQVVFTTLNVEPSIQTLKLVGATLNFRTLQEQMAIFQGKDLEGLNLSNIVLGEKGEVIFQLEMKFANP